MKPRWAWALVFLLGAALRIAPVGLPVDTRSWREADVSMIARNYYRGETTFARPQVDWGGDGPGYVESEFPLYPWLISVMHQAFGYSETHGRVLSVAFSILATLGFFALSRRLQEPPGALAAALFFALAPLAFAIAYTLQPDGLMFCASIWAVLAFVRWLDTDDPRWGTAAAAFLALAILVKAVAVHLGLLLAFLIWSREGPSGFARARYWAFGAAALLPPLAWYAHARSLWLSYGNSLGISNESHWVGLAVFTDPRYLLGILHNQVAFVWMSVGAVLVVAGLVLRRVGRSLAFALAWLGASLVYLVAIAGTSADGWAFYYHLVSLPAVALLFGAAVETTGLPRGAPELRFEPRGPWRRTVAVALVGLAALAYVQELRALRRLDPRYQRSPLVECARHFAYRVPRGERIVVAGSSCVDEDGRPVAYNASYFFYWMDRKGFSVCTQQQSLENIELYARRGARYLVAERGLIAEDFARALGARYGVAVGCGDAALYDLARHAG